MSINKYRTLPCEIEAIQFTGEYQNLVELQNFCGPYLRYDKGWYVETLEGSMKISLNDYIIKGLRGEFYPCKPDVFEKKYELIQ